MKAAAVAVVVAVVVMMEIMDVLFLVAPTYNTDGVDDVMVTEVWQLRCERSRNGI